jgi:hypothetical protein
MQAALTASAIVAIGLLPTVGARADCDARAKIEVEVAPTSFDPASSKLVAAQLESAVRALADERREPPSEPPCAARLLRIEVTWPDRDHADLHVEVRRGKVGWTGVRTVDLTNVPPDGRALAISIAATELVDETTEHAGTVVPATTAPTPPPPLRAAIRRAPRDPLGAFAPRLALEAFSDGPVLLGPDARVSFLVAPRVETAFRFGARASLDAISRASYVYGASVVVSARPSVHAWGVSGALAVDAIALASSNAHDTILVPALGVGAWLRLGSIARASLDASIGAPIRTEAVAARGVVLGAALGIALSF